MAKSDSVNIGGVTLTKDFVRERLATSTLAVEKAILALYSKQTENEKSAQITEEDNGMGFTGVDAEILSSFAEWITTGVTKYHKVAGKCLSDKQLVIARKKLPKYAGQLLRIAAERMPS